MKYLPRWSPSPTVEMKPVFRFLDVVDLVHHTLAKQQAATSLCWHDGADKIWVKIGVDHGEESFMISFQLTNVKSPNDKQNITPFPVFAAPDSPGNLAEYTVHSSFVVCFAISLLVEVLSFHSWSRCSFALTFPFQSVQYSSCLEQRSTQRYLSFLLGL